MKINTDTINRLEKLSMLDLTDSERQQIIPELERFIGLINRLTEFDTDQNPPLLNINNHEQTLSADKVEGMINQSEAFKNTKHINDVYFTVPKVINK